VTANRLLTEDEHVIYILIEFEIAYRFSTFQERFCGLVGSALDHRLLLPGFEYRRGHI